MTVEVPKRRIPESSAAFWILETCDAHFREREPSRDNIAAGRRTAVLLSEAPCRSPGTRFFLLSRAFRERSGGHAAQEPEHRGTQNSLRPKNHALTMNGGNVVPPPTRQGGVVGERRKRVRHKRKHQLGDTTAATHRQGNSTREALSERRPQQTHRQHLLRFQKTPLHRSRHQECGTAGSPQCF